MGVYLALTIPVAVFPETNFPRIVVGVDNGVFPIDQMLVTVTRPIEEAVNTVPGLDHLWSVTSRGTAEIDLFFSWKVDMYRTLELVNAAMARVAANAAGHRQDHGQPPDLRRVSDHGLQPDLGQDSAGQALGDWPTTSSSRGSTGRTASPSIVVQGGQVPEFEVQPDPAKLVQAGITIPNILDADQPQQHDRFARTDRDESPVGAEPGQRAGAHRRRRSPTS